MQVLAGVILTVRTKGGRGEVQRITLEVEQAGLTHAVAFVGCKVTLRDRKEGRTIDLTQFIGMYQQMTLVVP